MNPLDQLKDIQLPDAVSIWPPAWPWWLLMVVILTIVAVFVWQYKRQAWRRTALKQFNKINWQQPKLAHRDCNKLLKQITVFKFDKTSARLSGEEWLEYLDTKTKQPIFMPQLRPFAHILDEPNIQLDNTELQKAVRTWIRKAKC
ncbi:DUF4381 domain-containing protein [Oceaniserpentilla sp. 4NH20-0058]|uniref:DUF4381 domain-containing protein n=1 Tax=Oceaniserpentilla sp. 4NH20-0058 TaxID=3127660 RepID=UPI003107D2F7